jgi:hypothetical protein
LEQPFVLLGMKDTLEPKIRKALPENILSRLSLEKSASIVEVPGKTEAKPPANSNRAGNRDPRRPQPSTNEVL